MAKQIRKRKKPLGSWFSIGITLCILSAVVVIFGPDILKGILPSNGGDLTELSAFFSEAEEGLGNLAQTLNGTGDAGEKDLGAVTEFPDFSGEDSVVVNGNIPYFTEEEIAGMRGEYYSPLDSLGRCGPAWACINKEMMPTEERGQIGQVKPSGWHTVKYPDLIEDTYLYNRCHLIAYGLTGQNSNELNLITGTRYMNATSMLEYELKVMQYLDKSDNHVLYRVTPYFKGNELVARGVEMEAMSLEDRGASLQFHVFVYNYQPGIEIDYGTGDSKEKK